MSFSRILTPGASLKAHKPLIIAALLACQLCPPAEAAVLDFEGFGLGQIIDDEYAGVTIGAVNNRAGPNAAVIFDSNNPTGGGFDLAAPFSSPQDAGLSDNFEPGNILIIQKHDTCTGGFCSNPDDASAGGLINIEFDNPVAMLRSVDFFDIELDEDSGNGTVTLFDVSDALLGTFDVPFTGGDNTWGRLAMNVEDVKRIEINMAGSGAIDNIEYVPIPAAAWLFGSGLLGMLGMARRKKAA